MIMLQNRASESWRVILKLQKSEERATCNISDTDTICLQHFQLQQERKGFNKDKSSSLGDFVTTEVRELPLDTRGAGTSPAY